MAIRHLQTEIAAEIPPLGQAEPTTLPIGPGVQTPDRALASDLAERGQQEINGVTTGIIDPKGHLGESGLVAGRKCVSEIDEHGTNGFAIFLNQETDNMLKPSVESDDKHLRCRIERSTSDPGPRGGNELARRESYPLRAIACISGDEGVQHEGQQLRPPLTNGVAGALHTPESDTDEIDQLQGIKSKPAPTDESTNMLTTSQALVSVAEGEVNQLPTLSRQPKEPQPQLQPPFREEAAAMPATPRNVTSEIGQSEEPISNQHLWCGAAGAQESELHLWEPGPASDRDPVPRASSTVGEIPHYAADVRVFIGTKLIGKLDQIQRLGNQILQTRIQLAEKRGELRHHRSALRDSEADFMSVLSEAWARGNPPWSLHLTNLYEKIEHNRNVLGPLEEAYDEFEDRMDQQDYKLRKLEMEFHAAMSSLLEDTSGSAGILVREEDSESSDDGSSSDGETHPLHPLEYNYLEKVGDANIVKERMSNLDLNYQRILLETDLRDRHGIEPSKENSDFLKAYPLERAQLEEEASALDVVVTELRQICVDNGIIEQGQQQRQEHKQYQPGEPTRTPPTVTSEVGGDDELSEGSQHLAKYSRKYGEFIAGFTSTRDRVNRWLLDILRSSPIEITLYRSFQTGTALDDIQLDKLFSALFVQCWLTDSAATGDRLSPINSPTGTQESLTPNSALDRKSNSNQNKNKYGNNRNISNNNDADGATPRRRSATLDTHLRTANRDYPEDSMNVAHGTPPPSEPRPRTPSDGAALTMGLGGVFSNSGISIEEMPPMRDSKDHSSSYLTTASHSDFFLEGPNPNPAYEVYPTLNPSKPSNSPPWSPVVPRGQRYYYGDCPFVYNDNLVPLGSPRSYKTY